jgi:hypothetical protein
MLTKNVNTASILLTVPTETATATVNGIAPVGAGTHNVDASYSGDSNYRAVTSGTIPLTGGLALLAVSPSSLSFGNEVIGTTSASKTITLKNSGTAVLSITSIGITGSNAGDFSETTTCGSSLGAGASCSIKVTFKPTATGTRMAAVSITDNASGSPQAVPLSGTGTAAKLSATSEKFGDVALGVTSAAKKVTLTNVGTTSLSISGITISGANAGEFARTTTCGASLAAGGNCSISLTFKPTAVGTQTATLKISDNAGGSPQNVNLSGVGTTAKLSPTSLNFGSVTVGTTSGAKTITLTNVGTTTLTISGITLSGTDAGDFAQTNTCGASLAAGAACTIRVTFKPTTTVTRTGSLNVSDNTAGSPQMVSLSGSGT